MAALGAHVGAHADELVDELEAAVVDVLGDDRAALGHGHQRDRDRHEVGGEARDAAASRRRPRAAASSARAQRPSDVGDTRMPISHSFDDHDLEVLEPRADELDLAARDAARHEQRAGLDAVGHDLAVGRHAAPRRLRSRSSTCPRPITCAPMRLRNAARSVTSGSRAAFSITVVPLASTAAHMRFSVAPTLGNSSTIRAPCSASRVRVHEAVRDLDLGAHRLEAAQVHVDLAAADVVAAGQRDARLAAAREQRAEHVERRAHPRRRARTALRACSVAGRVDAHDIGRRLVDAARRPRAAGRSSRRGRAPAACCAAS